MVAPIKVLIEGDAAGLNTVLKGASQDVGKFGGIIQTALPAPLKAAVPAVKALGKATANVSKAAKDAAAEEKIFADAMVASGAAQGDWVAQTDAAIAAGQKLAFSDTETRKAILALSTATGDSAKSIELLGTAQDVARLSGVSLEQAADAVAKAYAGQDTALRRLLPGMAETEDSLDTITQAQKLAAGAADTFAESSEAGSIKANIAFDEIKETIGTAVLPALQSLSESLKPFLAMLGELLAKILPPLLTLLGKFFDIATKVAGAIGKITDAIGRLIGKIKELLGPLTDAVQKLREIDLNPFSKAAGGATPQGAEIGTFAASDTAGTQTGGPVTINIYGDPAVIEARVIRALRGYQFRNGPGSVFNPGRA